MVLGDDLTIVSLSVGNPAFRVTAKHMDNGKSKLYCSVIGSTFWGHVLIEWYGDNTSESVSFSYCTSRPFSDGTSHVSCEYECPTDRIQEPICRIEYGGRRAALTVNGTYDEIDHPPKAVTSGAIVIILGVMATCGLTVCFIVFIFSYVQQRCRSSYERFE